MIIIYIYTHYVHAASTPRATPLPSRPPVPLPGRARRAPPPHTACPRFQGFACPPRRWTGCQNGLPFIGRDRRFPTVELMSRKNAFTSNVHGSRGGPGGCRSGQQLESRRQGPTTTVLDAQLTASVNRRPPPPVSNFLLGTGILESTPESWPRPGEGPGPCGQDRGKDTKQAPGQLPALSVHLVLGPSSELAPHHPPVLHVAASPFYGT